MLIDQTIDNGDMIVHFKGEVSDEEYETIIRAGLYVLYMGGYIQSPNENKDGNIVVTAPEQLQ